MSEDWDAPMELIYTHELEELKRQLAAVTAQRDSALAALRRMEQPFEYSSGSVTVPEWLRDVRAFQ